MTLLSELIITFIAFKLDFLMDRVLMNFETSFLSGLIITFIAAILDNSMNRVLMSFEINHFYLSKDKYYTLEHGSSKRNNKLLTNRIMKI